MRPTRPTHPTRIISAVRDEPEEIGCPAFDNEFVDVDMDETQVLPTLSNLKVGTRKPAATKKPTVKWWVFTTVAGAVLFAASLVAFIAADTARPPAVVDTEPLSSMSPTATPSATPSASQAAKPNAVPSTRPTVYVTVEVTETVTAVATVTVTATETVTATPTPTPTPTS